MADVWTEQQQQAAIDELRRHGGSEQDLKRLRQFFEKAAESETRDVEISE
jgi:hypothetical protein